MSTVTIAGVPNLRDLGGLGATDGRRVRHGRLYRAELLTDTAPNESNAVWDATLRDEYAALGLALVIDLRSEAEHRVSPTLWAAGTDARVVEIPIEDGAPGTPTDLLAPVLRGERDRFTAADFIAYYVTLMEGHGEDLVRGVRAIAEADGRPALIHCSAGKDRTGVLVAMVLELLGVDRAAIVADYVRTGEVRPNRIDHYRDAFTARGVDPEAVRLMFETPAEVLDTALTRIAERHGSIRAYLEDHGLDAASIERLRAALLEDSDAER